MPKQLTQKDLEGGAVVIRKATPRAVATMGPDVLDVLKEITVAISKLVALHTMTKALVEKPIIQPDHSEILDRMAEIQFLTQQTMENMATALVDAVKAPPTFTPAPQLRELELSVTERDAWGRINKLKLTKG